MSKRNVADIYVRLSEQDRDKKSPLDESESIQNQKTMLQKFCKQNGFIINDILSDEDFSGADKTRPAWNKMLDDCKNGRCNIVVCKTLSRFSRDMEMVEKYVHGKFAEWGVRFIGVVDNVDTEIKANKKSRQINGLINEWYLEDLSENIKSTLSSKRQSGQFVGSFAPYGYLVDKNDKNHLVIDKTAAAVVKRIFGMYISGLGYISIAKTLNAEKIPPPCVRKKQLGSNYYNGNFEKSLMPPVWSPSAVYGILRREVYTGTLVQGRQEVVNFKTGKRRNKPEAEWDRVDGTHLPIIPKEVFYEAERLRLERGKSTNIISGEPYSLSGKVYCKCCGGRMWKMSYKLKNGRYQYLTCKTHKRADAYCENSRSVKLDKLEKLITEQINNLIFKYYDKKMQIQTEDIPPLYKLGFSDRYEIAELQEKINKNEKRTKDLYFDKLDGTISKEEYLKYREAIVSENTNLKERMRILTETEKRKYNRKPPEPFNQITVLDGKTVSGFIKKIYVGAYKKDEPREVTIEWNF